MRKTLAFALSLFALAYVGLAFAEDGENGDGQSTSQGQQSEQSREQNKQQREQDREQKKQAWEQKRESAKQVFEQERENLKQQWEKAKETFQNEREQFKEQFLQRSEEKKNLLAEFKNKFAEDRCANIDEKVKERTQHFGEREKAHNGVYVNLVNRLNKFVDRFKTSGLDTKNLESYVVVLQGKIDQFKTDYAAYIAKLKSSTTLTCGHSEGEFRGSLVDARAELKLVHEDAADIRNYVRTVIIPEIKVLKAQMPQEQDNENTNNDNQNNQDEENKTSDKTAPTVNIAAPADGGTYTTAQTVTISADATDNDKVEKVEFYEDGVLKGKAEEAPYAYSWAITSADNGAHVWTAKAYDDAEPVNSAESAPISLTVNMP